jgi:hypothetical protein
MVGDKRADSRQVDRGDLRKDDAVHRYWLKVLALVFGSVLAGGFFWGVDGVIAVGTLLFIFSCVLNQIDRNAFATITARMREALAWAKHQRGL